MLNCSAAAAVANVASAVQAISVCLRLLCIFPPHLRLSPRDAKIRLMRNGDVLPAFLDLEAEDAVGGVDKGVDVVGAEGAGDAGLRGFLVGDDQFAGVVTVEFGCHVGERAV